MSWFANGVVLLGPLVWLNLGSLFLFPFGNEWFCWFGCGVETHERVATRRMLCSLGSFLCECEDLPQVILP